MKSSLSLRRALTLTMLAAGPALFSGCNGGYGSGGNGSGNPPAAPTRLTATAGNAQVALNWTASSGATVYYVKRTTTSGGPYTTLTPYPTGTTFTDTGLANGTTYYYVVSAYNSYGQSGNSNEASATPTAGGTAPTAPTNLTATAGSGQVALTWNASNGATSYNVKRGATSGSEAQLATTSSTTYTDTTVTNGNTYYYEVTASNASGTSANSNEVNATPSAGGTKPAAPTGLVATAGNAKVTLTWNPSSGATGYNVLRGTSSGTETQLATTTSTTYTDTAAANGTTYYYVVQASNSSGTSGNSNEVSATPVGTPPPPDVTVTIDPTNSKPISPWIYGTNFYSGNTSPQPNFTIDRDGGNRWTAYNWINNGSNAGSDYFYENDNYLCNGSCNASIPAEAVRLFINGDQTNGLASLVTLQLQGYVSIDTTTVQVPPPFPDLQYFRPVIYQKSMASNALFTVTPPPATTDNNVYMDEFAWALDQKFLSQNIFGASPTHPTFISLDNEPDLWYSTHEEIQGSATVNGQKANNLPYTNFITKTVNLATALKDLSKNTQVPAGHFSNVVIFGPVNYGFNGIYSWQGDPTLSPTWTGNNWFADKYLAGIKAASTSYGAPLVDVYDFHWYSEATDGTTRVINMTGSSLTDPQIQAIVQSPRSLWDPAFVENSWITQFVTGGQPIRILTHLQSKINASNPGMKIAITEYENGGFNHIAGTIAQADNLGIFGSEGVFAANFWPPGGTYSYTLAAFRAYRDFDGAGSNFGDASLASTSSDVASVVVYASSDTTAPGRVVFVAINRSNAQKVTAINGQALSGTAHLYQMTGASAVGQTVVQPLPIGTMAASGFSLTVTLPAYSVTTIDVH